MTHNQEGELFKVLQFLEDIDVKIYNLIIEMLFKEKASDSVEFLANYQFQPSYGKYIFLCNNLEPFDKQWKQDAVRSNFKKITNVLQIIKEHEFNNQNYSIDIYEGIKKNLIIKISWDKNIIEFFKFLVYLTAFDERYIQCGSNSLHLLILMKVDLKEQSFENIRIRNTSLFGANFVRCDLSGSKFDNVNISGINLNQAQLINCKWRNLEINECSILNGHSHWVQQVSFSPDGKSLASCSRDNTIRLWYVKTGKIMAKLQGKDFGISVCFSSNNKLVALSSGKVVYLRNVKTGRQISKLDGHSNNVMSVNFSPDGTTLASGSKDKSICLWDVKTGQQKAKLDGHSSYVKSVNFSPDGTTLASGSQDSFILLWDVKTGQQKAKLDRLSLGILSVTFSPDGSTLASGSENQYISLWDVKTGQYKGELNGHSIGILSVNFSPDGITGLIYKGHFSSNKVSRNTKLTVIYILFCIYKHINYNSIFDLIQIFLDEWQSR